MSPCDGKTVVASASGLTISRVCGIGKNSLSHDAQRRATKTNNYMRVVPQPESRLAEPLNRCKRVLVAFVDLVLLVFRRNDPGVSLSETSRNDVNHLVCPASDKKSFLSRSSSCLFGKQSIVSNLRHYLLIINQHPARRQVNSGQSKLILFIYFFGFN